MFVIEIIDNYRVTHSHTHNIIFVILCIYIDV